MATTSTPMTLNRFIVEDIDDRGQSVQSRGVPTNSLLEPMPSMLMAMPKPHSTGISGVRIPDYSPVAPVEPPVYAMRSLAFPNGPASTPQIHSKKHKERYHHHQIKGKSNISYELKRDKVISSEKILSRDPKALADFLRLHGFIKPIFSVHLLGTHIETQTRIVHDSKGSHVATSTETITDFSFSIDLADLLSEEPFIYTVRDDVPAYRGGMRMAVETGGARPIELRESVEMSVQGAQKDAIKAGRHVGWPPWLVTAESSTRDDEAHMGATPQASSRSFEEWITDYVRSKRVVKEFILRKEIYTWDLDALTTSLEQLIRSTGYSSSISIKFQTTPKCVHVYSPNSVSKIFASYLWILLTSVLLIFPFLWMWRRWWPGAGGRWKVAGAAFWLKRWELVPGTRPGETEQGALERLGGPLGVGGENLRAGKEGVWVLKGVHEADWFRSWEESIRCGVRERRTEAWLTKRTLMNEIARARAIASELDHL